MNADNIVIILVSPQGSLNIGGVCRAMLNFGLSQLRLVAPEADHLNDDARRMAVKAKDILEGAAIYPDLGSALADCRFAFGTTRRFGKYREDLLYPEDAASMAAPLSETGKIALVFGREDKGLFTEELDLCQRFITIPAAPQMPSLNLVQAVTICLYEFYRSTKKKLALLQKRRKLAANEDIENMLGHMRETLLEVRFLDLQNPDHILRAFRRIFGRAQLNKREVNILQGLWSRIDWIEQDRRKKSSALGNQP